MNEFYIKTVEKKRGGVWDMRSSQELYPVIILTTSQELSLSDICNSFILAIKLL